MNNDDIYNLIVKLGWLVICMSALNVLVTIIALVTMTIGGYE